MATPPTRVGRYSPGTGNYSTTTSPKTTTETFDIQVGDRFWCQAQVENAGLQSVVTPTVSGGAITWTLQARVPDASDTNSSALWGWTGVCTTAATGVTITLDRPTTDTALWWGFSVTHVRGSDGVGVIWDANNGTGSSAPSSALTVAADSLVVFNVNDWNASDGTTRAYRMSATESNYFRDAAHHTVYGAYVLDTTAGSFDAGLTTPSTMRWGLIGVEFLGAAAPVVVNGRILLENGVDRLLLENGDFLVSEDYVPAGGTDYPVAGSIAATSTTTGSIALRAAVAGAVAASTVVAGAIVADHPLTGTVAATSTATGAIDVMGGISGTVAATSTVTGAIDAQHPIAGSVAAVSTTTGAITADHPLTGTVAATSGVLGAIAARLALAGTTPATSTTTGATTLSAALSGSIAATTAVSGTLFEPGAQNYPIGGTVAATSTTAGAITAQHPLAGTIAATTTVTGAARLNAAIAGNTATTSNTSGTITVRVGLTGTVAVVSQVAGQLAADIVGEPVPVVIAVPAEDRTIIVGRDTRTITVNADDRTTRVPRQTRTLEA